jgi:hypothetical protein
MTIESVVKQDITVPFFFRRLSRECVCVCQVVPVFSVLKFDVSSSLNYMLVHRKDHYMCAAIVNLCLCVCVCLLTH